MRVRITSRCPFGPDHLVLFQQYYCNNRRAECPREKIVVWRRKMEHYKIKKSGPHTFQNHWSSISNDKTETVRTILIFLHQISRTVRTVKPNSLEPEPKVVHLVEPTGTGTEPPCQT